jgi:hypothetical protein
MANAREALMAVVDDKLVQVHGILEPDQKRKMSGRT